MDESLFPPTYTYSNDEINDDDDDDDDEVNEEVKSNSNPADTDLTNQQADLTKQYLLLQETVAKLKEHVSRCHKRSSKYKSAKRRPPRIHDSQTIAELEMVKVKIGGKVQYQCNVCNKAFPRANNFLRHKIIHSEKLFPCEICGRKFRIQGYLKNHMKKIHSIENKQELLHYLKTHPASVEGDELKKEEVRTGGRKFFDYNAIERVKVMINGEVFYQCEICDKKLSRVRYYLNHITVHTGEKKFICHHCGRSFRLVTMLRVHMRVTHENIKDFSCDVCPRKFGTKNNLLEHQHIHTGERPYVCSKCGKRFKQKSALYIHNRSHTDYFPFKCPQCEAKFRIQSQLNYHMIKHTGETPFTCDFCGKAFPARCHLNQHRKCHLEIRPYPCRICEKAFRYRNNLNVHLKNCHKM